MGVRPRLPGDHKIARGGTSRCAPADAHPARSLARTPASCLALPTASSRPRHVRSVGLETHAAARQHVTRRGPSLILAHRRHMHAGGRAQRRARSHTHGHTAAPRALSPALRSYRSWFAVLQAPHSGAHTATNWHDSLCTPPAMLCATNRTFVPALATTRLARYQIGCDTTLKNNNQRTGLMLATVTEDKAVGGSWLCLVDACARTYT